jgi:hypothetical protein
MSSERPYLLSSADINRAMDKAYCDNEHLEKKVDHDLWNSFIKYIMVEQNAKYEARLSEDIDKKFEEADDEERAKKSVRPYHESYVHARCKVTTKMPRKLAETYAANPIFYGSTFCCGCRSSFPVGEFTWSGTNNVMGE